MKGNRQNLDFPKLKTVADDKICVTPKLKFDFGQQEKFDKKGERRKQSPFKSF